MNNFEKTQSSLPEIAARLRLTRDVFGYNQQEFAGRSDIAQNTYNQYEKGKKRISIDNALELCSTYRITLDWIYRGDPSGLSLQLHEQIADLKDASKK